MQTPDIPLSISGLAQAEHLAKAYRHINKPIILCSDYVRAQSTALAMQKQLSCEIIYIKLLRERNFGDLRGRSYDDIGYDFFAQDYHPPNGESYLEFNSRVAKAWQSVQQLAWQHDGDVVVVTHGLVLLSLFNEVLSLPNTRIQQKDIANTCVSRLDKFGRASYNEDANVTMLCDTSHLTDDLRGATKHGAA